MGQEWRRKRQRRLRGHKLGYGWPRLNVARLLTASLLLSVGLLVIGGTGHANAASTRAEYIAQVDPICQSFVASENAAYKAYRKNTKRWDHLALSGSVKAWLNATRRTSKSLMRFVQLDVALVEQIAAVSPPAADAGTVDTWLNDRRHANALTASAAAALNRPVPGIDKYFRQVGRANSWAAAGQRAIDGFGFQVCGVSV